MSTTASAAGSGRHRRHHLPAARLLGPHRPHPPVPGRRQGERQPAPVLLPRPPRAQDDQDPARRGPQARAGAGRLRLPPRPGRRPQPRSSSSSPATASSWSATARTLIDVVNRTRARACSTSSPSTASSSRSTPPSSSCGRSGRARRRGRARCRPPDRFGWVTLRTSPLDAAHRALGAKMVPFGGWDMPLAYADGTLAEHRACRSGRRWSSTSATSAPSGWRGLARSARLQAALTNDLTKVGPGRAQYTHLLDEADASVLDDIIVWWVATTCSTSCPTPRTPIGVVAAIGGEDVTASRAVLAVQGPEARDRLAAIAPEAAGVGPVPGGRGHRRRASAAWWPAPATPARTASSSPSPPIGRRSCGTP